MKYNNKHLTLSDRIIIEQYLNNGETFKSIANKLHKDPTTISKEIRKHRTLKIRKDNTKSVTCNNFKLCSIKNICNRDICDSLCKNCFRHNCRTICPSYETKVCGRLDKAPYVCNNCKSIVSCNYQRYIYIAKYADDCYHELLSSSREGINQTPDELQKLDSLISPLILKGQPIYHIHINHINDIHCSKRTLYRYIDNQVLTAKNIDLPRKVKYKPRNKKCNNVTINKEYRKGRTYADFNKFLKDNPNTQIVEMDTVEGQKGGKVLLTLLFRNSTFMLAFLMDNKTQECVKNVFDSLQSKLGIDVFKKLFPVILTDNGSEFQNPYELMNDDNGELRTNIFYCDSNCSWQKGMLEKNHEFIRYIVPKGASFDLYNQEQITLMINHINSTARDSLNVTTPFKLSCLLQDKKLHTKLSLQEISPDDVVLKPTLLNKFRAQIE